VAEPPTEDNESQPLLEALKSVAQWKEPVTRGKKTFDDKEFYASLQSHFARKGYLTDRQRAALKRMVARYRQQVPGYEELAQRCAIGAKKREEGA
jgi:hypothetical protein